METKDYLTLLLATIGTLLGIFNFIKDIWNNKIKVDFVVLFSNDVEIEKIGKMINGCETYETYKEKFGEKLPKYISFDITNRSAKPIYIENVGLKSTNNKGIFDFSVQDKVRTPKEYPIMLAPGEKRYIHGFIDEICLNAFSDGFTMGYLKITHGNEYLDKQLPNYIKRIFF